MNNEQMQVLYELKAKVDILWAWMVAGGALLVGQFLLTIVNIIKTSNGRFLRKQDYMILKDLEGHNGKGN